MARSRRTGGRGLRGWAREALRTELWPLPLVGVVLSVVAGVLLPRLDGRVDGHLGGTTSYLFGGGADAARTVLSAVAGSLITVTSLTFSLTVVTLQLASSQFSPRLLRTFTRDRFVHVTLALFLGTFTYALTVLRTVRDSSGPSPGFVPQVSVTLAFALTVASVLGLVFFLAHLAREIRVETTLRTVHHDASDTIERVLGPREPGRVDALPTDPAHAVPLLAGASGFLLEVAERDLVRAATAAGALVRLDAMPGDSLVRGTPVGAVWGTGGPLPVEAVGRLRDAVDASVSTGFERNETQDVAFGLRQLTDVVAKALSPGINDPTTAIHALGHSAALLAELADRELGTRVLRDDAGAPRVVLARPGLGDLLELAVAQPRRYGASDPFVLGRIAALLGELAWRVGTAADRDCVRGQLGRLRDTITGSDFDDAELARLAAVTAAVDARLGGRAA